MSDNENSSKTSNNDSEQSIKTSENTYTETDSDMYDENDNYISDHLLVFLIYSIFL